MRKIKEKTILTVLVNLKCLGKMGKTVNGFTKKEKEYIFNELERLGYIKENSIEITPKGNEVVKKNLNLVCE